MPVVYGARQIAQALQDLGVEIIFGLPGLPVIDIANEGMKIGMRFISFRNEQASVYAAAAYGYLTGKPGVCISVGGPGMLHVAAGIPFAAANSWPLLILSGAAETHNIGKGAFQEIDAMPFVQPHAKLAVRPLYPETVPKFIKDAYRAALFGRPGPAYVDLAADLILGHFDLPRNQLAPLPEIPKSISPPNKIKQAVDLLKSAEAPLVIFGKGTAYSKAEKQCRTLIENTNLLFFPTPMAKGIVPDSDKRNISAARSTALKEADVVLVLGGKLNWILSFGLPPKWRPDVKIIQVDLDADELGKNSADPALSLLGDLPLVLEQLIEEFGDWRWQGHSSTYHRILQAARKKNEQKAAAKAKIEKKNFMTYERCFDVIKKTLDGMSNPSDGDIVYVSEGANAMDISRSIFTMEQPRIRLDAGTHATMGVGLGYAIAAFAAYNVTKPEGSAGPPGRKKIVAIEGDSAFGFSGMEVETMARYEMDILIFVINNGGLYRGDSYTEEGWRERQQVSIAGKTGEKHGLTATSLGYETPYHKIADMSGNGAIGLLARTPAELKKATEVGFKAKVPVVVNVMIDPQADSVMDFSWLDMAPPKKGKDAKL